MSIHVLLVEICILFVMWPHKTTPLRFNAYLWVSSSQYVTTLKSLVAIGVLIVKRKNVSSYKYVVPLKNWVDWITTRREKISQSQKCTLWKKSTPKLKHIIFPLMTTLYNFALKIETSWAKKVVKPISETWNAANNVFVYVWFIHSLTKMLKTCTVKKNNSKCTKFAIKS